MPEFNLLWKDRVDRQYPLHNGKKKQEYILISIEIEWPRSDGTTGCFGVELRYHSPQTIYAIQDTPETVAKHYGRFLPQDKAALAAQVLNKVWEVV